jgi:MFS family permease
VAEIEVPFQNWRLAFRAVPPKVKWLIYLSSLSGPGYGFMWVLVTAYLPEIEKLSAADVGLLLGLNGAMMVASAIPIGILSDRRGRKWIFMMGLISIPPSLVVFALTSDLLSLVIASAVLGVAEGAFATTWNALIADQTTVETRNAAFSLSFLYGTMSSAIGFLIPFIFPSIEAWTGISSHALHTQTMFILALLASASPIALWPMMKRYHEEMHPSPRVLRGGKSTHLLLKFSGINSLIGLGAGFIIPLIPTWLWLKYGVGDDWSGPLLAASSALMAFASLASTPLAHKYGMIRASVLVQGTSAIFMLSLAFMPNAMLAAGIYLVRSALMNMAVPILDSYLMGIVTKEERGMASAINSIMWRLPNSISTIFGGWILAAGSYALPFIIATSFYAVAVTLFYRTFRDIQPTG